MTVVRIQRELRMTPSADRVRFSEDMASVTASLVSAMLNSNMLSRSDLVGSVRDIHAALLDVAMDGERIEELLGDIMGVPNYADDDGPDEDEAPQPALSVVAPSAPRSEAIRSQVSQLLGMSETVFEPLPPPRVRVIAPSPLPDAPPEAPSAPLPISVEVRPAEPAAPPSPRRARDEQWVGDERRSRPVKTRRKNFLEAALPKRLSSVEEALAMDYIVCLEDGKKVKDLGEHLARIGISQDQYRAKWKLPREYPMQAPSTIVNKAPVFEINLVTGKMRASGK